MFKICYLNLNKLSSTLERYFDKCIASHILNSIIIVIYLLIGFSFPTLAFPKHSFSCSTALKISSLSRNLTPIHPPHIFNHLPFVDPLPPPSSTDLNPLVCLVHELEEFVDHGLEKPPVSSKEARVLSHDVHDVGGYDGLVVLSLLLLT